MEFSEDIFVGGSITDEEDIIFKLKNGEFPTDVYCVCRCPEGKFRYEIMSCRELKKELRRKHFVICGIGAVSYTHLDGYKRQLYSRRKTEVHFFG